MGLPEDRDENHMIHLFSQARNGPHLTRSDSIPAQNICEKWYQMLYSIVFCHIILERINYEVLTTSAAKAK